MMSHIGTLLGRNLVRGMVRVLLFIRRRCIYLGVIGILWLLMICTRLIWRRGWRVLICIGPIDNIYISILLKLLGSLVVLWIAFFLQNQYLMFQTVLSIRVDFLNDPKPQLIQIILKPLRFQQNHPIIPQIRLIQILLLPIRTPRLTLKYQNSAITTTNPKNYSAILSIFSNNLRMPSSPNARWIHLVTFMQRMQSYFVGWGSARMFYRENFMFWGKEEDGVRDFGRS